MVCVYEKDARKIKLGMDGIRMPRKVECAIEDEIGVLHSGKIFWYNRKRIVADREE
jgi:hypothetical protein